MEQFVFALVRRSFFRPRKPPTFYRRLELQCLSSRNWRMKTKQDRSIGWSDSVIATGSSGMRDYRWRGGGLIMNFDHQLQRFCFSARWEGVTNRPRPSSVSLHAGWSNVTFIQRPSKCLSITTSLEDNFSLDAIFVNKTAVVTTYRLGFKPYNHKNVVETI